MIAKTLTVLAGVAAAGFVMKRFMELREPQAVRVKPHRRDDGRIRKLRQAPKPGEYYAEEY